MRFILLLAMLAALAANPAICDELSAEESEVWALEQALRNGTCAAVLAWPQTLDTRAMRRLQLAAETGNSVGFLFRKSSARPQPSAVQLRLHLDCAESARHSNAQRLSVDILKRRGGWPVGPVTVAVQSAAANHACPSAPVA